MLLSADKRPQTPKYLFAFDVGLSDGVLELMGNIEKQITENDRQFRSRLRLFSLLIRTHWCECYKLIFSSRFCRLRMFCAWRCQRVNFSAYIPVWRRQRKRKRQITHIPFPFRKRQCSWILWTYVPKSVEIGIVPDDIGL